MTLADDLITLNNIKQTLKTLLLAKNIITGSDDFTAYAPKIQGLLTIGGLKTSNITYNHQYTVATTTLANSKPANPNFSYTIASGYFPAFSITPAFVGFWGRILAAGQNNDAANRTVYYQIDLIRGGITTTVAGGNASILTSTKTWCLNADVLSSHNALLSCSPATGDIINVYLWSDSTANVTLTKYGLEIYPAPIFPVNNPNVLLVNTGVTWGNSNPAGFTVSGSTIYPVKYINSTGANLTYLANSGSALTYPISNFQFDSEHPIYGLFDNLKNITPTSSINQSATYYYRNNVYYPTSITWSPTNIAKGVNLC